MTRTLLVLTTANQLAYTRMAVDSLRQCNVPGVDLLVVDDASEDGTVSYCTENGIRVVAKPEPRGVTDSWNTAYRVFRDEQYDLLLLANNDILIPRGALEVLIQSLEQYVIVAPLSTAKGVGHQPAQAFAKHHQIGIDDTNPANVQKIQDYLNGLREANLVIEVPYVNGFLFGMNRGILRYELSGGDLFASDCINVNNEDDLCRRVGEKKACCVRSFVFHFKGVSFQDFRFGKYYLCQRELTWKEAKSFRPDDASTLLKMASQTAYQEGFVFGQKALDPSPTWFGYPRWMLKEWCVRGLRYLRLAASRDRQARDEARCDWSWFAGRMAGQRGMRRKRQETSE